MPGDAVVAMINDRFVGAQPSNDLAAAGVLVHNFDEISNGYEPWLPCSGGGCARKFSDRFPCSIIYQGMTNMYKPTNGGFVIAPLGARVLCSYSRDGLTMTSAKVCPIPTPADCIPGCGHAPYEWCPEAKPWRCAWPPHKMDEMLRNHKQFNARDHNEVVLDARAWTERLPMTIQLVWYLEKGNAIDDMKQVQDLSRAKTNAEDVHRRFLQAFGITGSDVPLVSFNPTRALPFRCVRCS